MFELLAAKNWKLPKERSILKDLTKPKATAERRNNCSFITAGLASNYAVFYFLQNIF
jgi:hypothetical protein